MRAIIFITVFIIIYTLTCFYVYTRSVQAFSMRGIVQKAFLGLFILISVSLIAGKLIDHLISINIVGNILVKVGAIGLAVILFSFIIIIFIDIVRLVNFVIPIYPKFITANIVKIKLYLGIVVALFVSGFIIYGYINAASPVITTLNLEVDKKVPNFKSLNVVAVSDIHLGTYVNTKKTKRLVDEINKIEPDIVLFAGDITDDNIRVVKHYKLMEHFKNVKSKYGIYAITGNHEYIGITYKELDYYNNNGVKLLRDSAVLIDNSFYIVGREDIQSKEIYKKDRKTQKELLNGIDKNLPIILLDHQPYNLQTSVDNGIDLQISGHTHHGQFWPFHFITKAMFEVSYGYLLKGNTHFFVTSGYGTAGPPIRIGNHSEIVNIKINFAQ